MGENKTIIIGDVHGCYTELAELLDKAGATDRDRLIFVGDLITKGPSNREVLDFVQRARNCEVVLGNHEYILAENYRGKKVRLEAVHLEVIEELGKDYIRHVEWISRLPSYIEFDDYLVVHAGVRPGVPLRRQKRHDLAFLRTLEGKPESRTGTPWFERYKGRRRVVFGHWVFREPYVRDKVIGIDTGCVYGGKLTSLVLPRGLLVQVQAHQRYARKREV